jgi:hypothetical protein
MIGITVSTKYEDILEIVVPLNYHFFDKWYIVTDKNDQPTIDILKKWENVIVLYFDFYSNGKVFNKGGAVKMAQDLIGDTNDFILLLDSDIILPENFGNFVTDLKENVLYGTEFRYDYHSLEHYKKGVIDYNYTCCKNFVGYFQLYKNSAFRYQESNNCMYCDEIFRDLFKQRITLKGLAVKHLGMERVNWNGRKNHNDFIKSV